MLASVFGFFTPLCLLNFRIASLLFKCCTQPLEQFSIGGSEDLSQFVPDLLQVLIKQSPEKVTLLGLASVKEDFLNYSICDLQPSLITSFTNLKVSILYTLSIFYLQPHGSFLFPKWPKNKFSSESRVVPLVKTKLKIAFCTLNNVPLARICWTKSAIVKQNIAAAQSFKLN